MFSKTTITLTQVVETSVDNFPQIEAALAEMPYGEDQNLIHLLATTSDGESLILTVLAELYGNSCNVQCFALRSRPWHVQPCTFQQWPTKDGMRYQLI